MRELLNKKLQIQFFEKSKQALDKDAHYLKLKEHLNEIYKYSIPSMTFSNGVLEAIEPQSAIELKNIIDDFIRTKYPQLKQVPEAQNQAYRYMQPRSPQSLKLNHIDKRLTLFSEYLKYKLSEISIYKGMIFTDALTFDQWLYVKNHDALTQIDWNYIIN
jgi:hypothetical protein